MRITALSVKGSIKDQCEDTLFIGDTIISDDSYVYEGDFPEVLGVADGVGGNPGGQKASRFISKLFSEVSLKGDEKEVKANLENVNRSLINYAAGLPGEERMASTLTAMYHGKQGYYVAHVGNTRLYVAQGRYLKQFTNDHTSNQIASNMIYGCFGGADENLLLPLEISLISPNDLPQKCILTSDGIHDHLDVDRLEELLNSDADDLAVMRDICDEAKKNGSKDDMSIIMMQQ